MAKKKTVPNNLQTAFYEIADKEMEKHIQLGLLTNRFSIREFAMQMMCRGYYFEENKKKANAKKK